MSEGNLALTNLDIYEQEKSMLSSVTALLNQMVVAAADNYRNSQQYALSENFEEQDRQVHYSEAEKDRRKRLLVEGIVYKIIDNPYFAHIQLLDQNQHDMLHCLLTDNEDINESIDLHGETETFIFPFKQDPHREFLGHLFHLYQEQTGESFQTGDTIYDTVFIRNDDIASRELINATQLFPYVENEDFVQVDCDELLGQKLKEFRKDVTLRNIIATLQRMQFHIIRQPASASFVVQGCAGSGKSQCLIHRLFYLRDVYSKEWDKVLLITPTQLFRNYSSNLMHRYRLTDVNNMSIADFYRHILEQIDPRFRNRQYKFELSEEYLPDEYLLGVYSKDSILKIRREISRAITLHVDAAVDLLGLKKSQTEINGALVQELAEKLQKEIDAFDVREAGLANDEALMEVRNRIDELNKRSVLVRSYQERAIRRIDELNERKEKFDNYLEAYENAREEIVSWDKLINGERQKRKKNLKDREKGIKDLSTGRIQIKEFLAFFDAFYSFLDVVSIDGKQKRANEDYRMFLTEYLADCENDLSNFLDGKSQRVWLSTWKKDMEDAEQRRTSYASEIIEIEEEIEQKTLWLASHLNDSGYRQQNSRRRAALEREHYYLSRIESSVFESEVWNALAPLKEKCGVQALDIERLENGKNRETRILYKSDLMFYLRIYAILQELDGLPEYNLICVDEGQDLHSADFEMIRELFPTAKLNIFGDLAQSLHEGCGLTDWIQDTGLNSVFTMDKNYRNPPEIVEFCNRTFGENMEYCGTLDARNAPKVLETAEDLKESMSESTVIIVRDKSAFDKLSSLLDEHMPLTYLDTSSSSEVPGTISCYSIYAAKGLEFRNVVVYPEGMNHNQQVVACTRATETLFYCDLGGKL